MTDQRVWEDDRDHDDDGRTVSVWMSTTAARRFAPHLGPLDVDVCVVGAGIAGLSTAYRVTRAGLSVVVLDDGTLGGGQTKRTTGHLSSVIDDHFIEIERIHGPEGARVAASSHAAAIDWIEATIAAEDIACGFKRVDGYLLLAGNQSREWLDQELEAARRAGLSTAEHLDACPGIDRPDGPCLRFPRQAQFDPLRYLAGLATAAERHGAMLLESHVESIEKQSDDRLRVRTRTSADVSARFVVVATNSPIHERVAVHTKQAPYRTFAIAMDLPRGAVPSALYWDTLDPYHYVRLADNENDPSREVLIVGGEDQRLAPIAEGDARSRYVALESWARRHFSASKKVVGCWSGQILETIDGLAFIGPTPSGPSNVLMISGDSGMGLTHGTIASGLLTDRILGRDNEWAPFYDPSRKSVSAAPTFIRENLRTALGYAEWLKHDIGDPTSLGCDRGGVFGFGANKRAIYRDAAGLLHSRSALCPHLGGVVGWNDAEKTWDCQCHGSRFDRYGRVVQGPANVDLADKP